jgi:hypothetical protein
MNLISSISVYKLKPSSIVLILTIKGNPYPFLGESLIEEEAAKFYIYQRPQLKNL